jgi:glycerol-1-phosphate dehydrogenase [NAD(P)+]
VDGFASTGAPLIVRGFKQTIPACSPEAIFADLGILAAAPRAMIAAGFGDLLGTFTSLADWRLGRLLLDEPYCPLAAETTMRGLNLCLENVEEIASGSPRGVGLLMEGLLLSGIAMLMVGNSRPASGSEHHLSHFWEMRYLQEGRRAELHGAKVGVACVLMAGLYQTLRHMPLRDVEAALNAYAPPARAEEEARITRAFGPIAPQVVRENLAEGAAAPLSPCAVEERWREVRAIADSVPEPERLAAWLARAGGPATPEDLGIAPDLVAESLSSAMYVRNRFTVLRLARMVLPAR